MDPLAPKPKFSADIIRKRFQAMQQWVEQAAEFATALDGLGKAEDHPEASEARQLCGVRDGVDLELARMVRAIHSYAGRRAERTRCVDLLLDEMVRRKGNVSDALRHLRRYYELNGAELAAEGEPCDESFPSMLLWDTYLRVSALPELAAKFPRHLQHAARQMHGWPMIVSQHLDHRAEFEQIAATLELGKDYPLAVGPRKRRGAETPLLRYLEPQVWRLHTLRQVLLEAGTARAGEDFAQRIYGFWWEYPEPPPTPEVQAILQQLPALPPLTRQTACEWSRKVIVPLILLEDAKDRETCAVATLRNIWRHRAVKSRTTFRSRLHSAVTDTLQRFGRPA